MHKVEHGLFLPLGIILNSRAWQSLDVEDLLAGNRAVSDLFARLRILAERANRCAGMQPGSPLRPGEVIALTLIQEALRHAARFCWHEANNGQLERAVRWIEGQGGRLIVQDSMAVFVDGYPIPGRSIEPAGAAAEMVLLSLAMENPAAEPYRVLYDDDALRAKSDYEAIVAGFDAFFASQPPVPRRDVTLMSLLRQPMRASPHSLAGQIDFILEHFRDLQPDWLLQLMMTVRGILREEEAMRGLGPGPAEVLSFYDRDEEVERFTEDRDWMANVVLLAKSTYVWLDQLSKKHGRSITRLDEIPDEELDRIARWGFTGLWLIGLWERSPASEEIKRRMGNPEAMASAYSLWDFSIAHDLGGEEAYTDLAERASKRGIRLAADMVPNHVGICSKWVVENPDWFLQLDHPPFPGYRFTGPDLSRTPGLGLRIEDGYWSRSDAAVVFERVDYATGEHRYIYHGNDGTSMPWNDTAQLDYLNPLVREVVIQSILEVARKFPIIRFDAAMTLARRHIQRLWYPAPGDGGAIPSRSERGMSRDDFLVRMPKEFWREVVDRVLQEEPETLLVAEAFWLMEGFFVRTLGMHRVYNSAFMNMLKMEENEKYRQTVKNVLEYSPRILKRFVNFMSNPDERTAIEQFGEGDKYSGCAVLLVTMPGLPMFAHGQIEGYTERYGMEFRRSYSDEAPNPSLVDRHEREIFPLMRRRYLFSQVENFAFYDFVSVGGGHVDESVFAYSNRAHGERALVVYNNAYSETAGWIRMSSSINKGSVDVPHLERRSLGEALDLSSAENTWYVFRDHIAELEYIRNAREVSDMGLYVELGAYGRHVFLHWREIVAADEIWARVAHRLNGRGVPSLDETRRDLELEPLTEAFGQLCQRVRHRYATASDLASSNNEEQPDDQACPSVIPSEELEATLDLFLSRLQELHDEHTLQPNDDADPDAVLPRIRYRFLQICGLYDNLAAGLACSDEKLVDRVLGVRRSDGAHLLPIMAILRCLPTPVVQDGRLARVVASVSRDSTLGELLMALRCEGTDRDTFERLRGFLLVNRAHNVQWYNAERMQALLQVRRLYNYEAILGGVTATTALGEVAPVPIPASLSSGPSATALRPEATTRSDGCAETSRTPNRSRKPTAADRASATEAVHTQLRQAAEAHIHLQNAADMASCRWDDFLMALDQGTNKLAATVTDRDERRRLLEQAATAAADKVQGGAQRHPASAAVAAAAVDPGGGPRIYNLFPLLAGSVADWHSHLDRIAGMGFEWIFINPFHHPGGSGSLYAVSDYYALHPLFQRDSPQPPAEALAGFCEAAAARGLRVMMDLVINHTANDSPLTTAHPDWYVREDDGKLRSPRAVDPDDPSKVTIWGDLAELDYRSRPQRTAMTSYWKGVVQHHSSLGIEGFRCDAAYKVPGEVWAEIIADARQRAEPVFFAETLGCQPHEVEQLARAKFDYFFNSNKWWDFRQDWLLDQYEQFRRVAPSVGFPESHDTERLVTQLRREAGNGIDAETIAKHYRLRYLFAAYFSSGVMVPIGYEYGFENALHVVSTRPEDWEKPRFDLGTFMRQVHTMKRMVPALNEEGPQRRLGPAAAPVVALLRESHDNRSLALALINPDPATAARADVAGVWEAEGLPPTEAFTEVTPGLTAPKNLSSNDETLEPLTMRVFAARRDDVLQRTI